MRKNKFRAESGEEVGGVQIDPSTNAFFLYGTIDQDHVFQIIKFLIESPGDTVYLYIDSLGGCLHSAFAMYEALRGCGKKIITYAAEEICSAAMVVYLAGDVRYASVNAYFLIHEVSSHLEDGERGTSKNLKNKAQEVEESSERLFKFIRDHTKLTYPMIKRKVDLNVDWSFKTKEAVKLGIAHVVGFPFPGKEASPVKIPYAVSGAAERKRKKR